MKGILLDVPDVFNKSLVLYRVLVNLKIWLKRRNVDDKIVMNTACFLGHTEEMNYCHYSNPPHPRQHTKKSPEALFLEVISWSHEREEDNVTEVVLFSEDGCEAINTHSPS